ncbi:MAG: transaldolase family protein, partial [Candidatus Nanoarchaeia archaeon]
MQIFIDTAKIDEIRTAISWGIVDGITTNPSLIRKAAESTHIRKIDKYIDEILKAAGKRPVSLEVKGGSSEEMLKQARKLYRRFKKKGNNVVIKIPIDPAMEYHHPGHFEGLKAISALSKARIPVNVTLVFSPEQALLAAKAGATYVSPFAGRIDDLLRQEQK